MVKITVNAQIFMSLTVYDHYIGHKMMMYTEPM